MATPGTQREDAKDFIVELLARSGDKMELKALDRRLRQEGYGDGVINRAKQNLAEEKQIRRYQVGNGEGKTWYIELCPTQAKKC